MRRHGRRGLGCPVPVHSSSWLSAFLLAFACLLLSVDAQAYPWMIRHGYTNCSGCHADPSGGELLTLYGHAISYEVLSTRWGGSGSGASEPTPSESESEDADADAEESDASIRRRIARATASAAHAKSAPRRGKKAIKEEDVELEEEEEGADEEGEDEEGAEEDADSAASEDEEDEAPAEAAAPEPSPFEGMSGLTGPLFGLLSPSDKFLLGGSIRLATLYDLSKSDDTAPAVEGEEEEDSSLRFFPMQIDLYGQLRIGSSLRFGASLGAVKVPAGSLHGRPAQVTANQDDGFNLASRTHWVGLDFGDGAHTVRAGRLNLPFGIRMSEHTMWVRDRTQTDRESDQQHGVSLYMGFDSVRFELMGILGNYQINPDRFRERGYAGYVEIAPSPGLAVGLSSLYTIASDDRLEPAGLKTVRHAHGPFLRWAPAESVAIMAEADVLLRSRRDAGYVGYVQVDVEPVQGLHFIGTGELLDAGYPERLKRDGDPRSAGLGRPLPGGWLSLQWFFLPHFDLRVDAIIRDDKALLSQLHVYL